MLCCLPLMCVVVRASHDKDIVHSEFLEDGQKVN